MNYLLDTNHAAAVVTISHPVRRRFLSGLKAGDTFTVSIPVVAETLFGIGMAPRATQNYSEWAKLRFDIWRHIPDERDAENAAVLQCLLRRQGWQLENVDAFSAMIAIRYDLVLLTTDKDFTAVPNLICENWFIP